MGATVKVGCPQTLARLLADAPGVSEVATGNAGMVTYHCHQAMFSLPRLLAHARLSPGGPYLKSQSQAGWSCRRRKASCGSAYLWQGLRPKPRPASYRSSC